MSEEFTIEQFIQNRWAEARTELGKIAPRFVQSMQDLFGLSQSEITSASNVPKPENSLTEVWFEVLESTYDVCLVIDKIDITLERMEKSTASWLARYYCDVWDQTAYNLIDKTKSLISHTCKLYRINGKTRARYHSRLNTEVKSEIDKRRTAIVHGANRPGGGANPIAPTVFTDKRMWEVAVFIGPKMIKNSIASSREGGRYSVDQFYRLTKERTDRALRGIGNVLESFDQEIKPGSSARGCGLPFPLDQVP